MARGSQDNNARCNFQHPRLLLHHSPAFSFFTQVSNFYNLFTYLNKCHMICIDQVNFCLQITSPDLQTKINSSLQTSLCPHMLDSKISPHAIPVPSKVPAIKFVFSTATTSQSSSPSKHAFITVTPLHTQSLGPVSVDQSTLVKGRLSVANANRDWLNAVSTNTRSSSSIRHIRSSSKQVSRCHWCFKAAFRIDCGEAL